MNTTHTEFGDGDRFTITAEFISQRTLRVDDDRIYRFLVEDEAGRRHKLLTLPADVGIIALETGTTYRFSGLLGSNPVRRGIEAVECPQCNHRLRQGRAVDTISQSLSLTAFQLGFDVPFGVIDEQTTITQLRSEEDDDDDEAVDDWRPMGTENEQPAIQGLDYVCDACGATFASYEVHGGGDSDPSHVIENAAPTMNAAASTASPDTLGMATGGAKDVTNFRENIATGYTPQPEAISDEGLFYDYHFETGGSASTDALFAPRFATAASIHPLTGEREHYLSVGLDSTLSMADFERPQLDIVAVLDVSGSMNSPFDQYYYDEHGRRQEIESDATTKMEAATKSLCALTEQLHDEDRLGVVLFNHRAHVAKPLRDVGRTDMPAIRRHIQEIAAGGSTNMEDGFEAALDMLVDEDQPPDVERRVVFMTDMMPNTGATGESQLTQTFADAAVNGVHTTFVGMGLDANADLADALSGIRGANHYFVHSAAEFERRLGEEFDYMVTPLVYNLGLQLKTDDWTIAAVHGSPNAETATGQLLDVGTLFPSPKQNGEARGGVVLVRLEPIGNVERSDTVGDVDLVASWTERDGSTHSERVSVSLPDEVPTYDHTGIRKAIALARYARELRVWAADLHDRAERSTGVDDWLLADQRGQHERESVPLVVPDRYTDRFDALRDYLATEMETVADETMQQEVDLLEMLCREAPETPTEVVD